MAEESVLVASECSFETPSLMEPRTLIAVSVLTFLLIFSFFALALTDDSSSASSSPEMNEYDDWRG